MTDNTETKWPKCAQPGCPDDARRGEHCWAHQPPPTDGSAVVFWDHNGHWWTPDDVTRHGPFTGPDSLDDAITDAKRAGHKIVAVNRTRGNMPAVSPKPLPAPEQPAEVLSGSRSA